MSTKKYNGVVVPMVTPVTPSGMLDKPAVERIIKSFVEAGVSPLLMGTTGEGNSVSTIDGQELIATAVKAAEGKITIYAGLTGNSFIEQLKQAGYYSASGADVIVATLPSYYSLTPEQMENYYKTLADSIKGPLMLYNIASFFTRISSGGNKENPSSFTFTLYTVCTFTFQAAYSAGR